MRFLSFLLFICLGLTTNVFAQGGVDITTAVADAKTFIFDDDKHTVHGYIYASLKEQTSCCGNDAVYLEIKFDAKGVVTSSKALTGKNECYKKSITDIVKNVRWDTKGANTGKTIYFEVKPIIPCSGSPGENQYQAIAGVVNSSNSGTESSVSRIEEEVEEAVVEVEEEEVEEAVEEAVVEVEEEMMEEVEEVEEAVVEEEEEVEESSWANTDDFLSDGGSTDSRSEESSTVAPVKPIKTTNSNNTSTASTTMSGAQQAEKYSGPVRIPPQEQIEYVSKGERSPTEGHRETFVNTAGDRISNPQYKEGENQLAVKIRQELSKTGYCGLAQAAFELTIDPQGNVVETRLLAVNNEKIKDAVPSIVNSIKFQSTNYASNYRSYHQFKAYFRCGEEEPNVNLEEVPNMIEPLADNK